MEIELEEIDHNLSGFEGEIYLEGDKLLVDLDIKKYEFPRRYLFSDDSQVETTKLEVDIIVNSIYFVAESGIEINVFSREMEEFVKELITIT
jgi:hypothetical protein